MEKTVVLTPVGVISYDETDPRSIAGAEAIQQLYPDLNQPENEKKNDNNAKPVAQKN